MRWRKFEAYLTTKLFIASSARPGTINKFLFAKTYFFSSLECFQKLITLLCSGIQTRIWKKRNNQYLLRDEISGRRFKVKLVLSSLSCDDFTVCIASNTKLWTNLYDMNKILDIIKNLCVSWENFSAKKQRAYKEVEISTNGSFNSWRHKPMRPYKRTDLGRLDIMTVLQRDNVLQQGFCLDVLQLQSQIRPQRHNL